MSLGSLEMLCPAIFILLLILLAALIVLALLKKPREIPGRFLTPDDAPPLAFDTVFKLHHYFPLPEGFAYTEDDDGTPTIIRLDDNLPLPYTVEEERLIFAEPYRRPDGSTGTRTHELQRQRRPAIDERDSAMP